MKKLYYLAITFLAANFAIGCNDNGDRSQSSIVPLVKGKTYQDPFKIYNNPKTDRITISYYSMDTGSGMITVYFEDGRVHGKKQVGVNKGTNTWEYKFPNNPGGVYIIRFTFNKVERVQRVFKART